MEFVTRISNPHSLSPTENPSHSETSFPIIAIAIIGILATAFLLVTYYAFVIKCCLNWHSIDLLRRLSQPRRRPAPPHSPNIETRGLNESVIRSIPLLQYKKTMAQSFKERSFEERSFEERSFEECAICLSEFEEDEKLRIFPICNHLFHIDCVDVWLQNNTNCPLCRTSVCGSVRFGSHGIAGPSSSRRDLNPFVVIEVGINESSGESPVREIEEREVVGRKGRKLQKVMSLGDEREKEEFCKIQPIRRSVSMDSSAERGLYLAVREAVQRNSYGSGVSSVEDGNGRGRRSLFSFGQSWSYRNAVLPLGN